MDRIGSGICPLVGLGVRSVESFGFHYTVRCLMMMLAFFWDRVWRICLGHIAFSTNGRWMLSICRSNRGRPVNGEDICQVDAFPPVNISCQQKILVPAIRAHSRRHVWKTNKGALSDKGDGLHAGRGYSQTGQRTWRHFTNQRYSCVAYRRAIIKWVYDSQIRHSLDAFLHQRSERRFSCVLTTKRVNRLA